MNPKDSPSILGELAQALVGADRCLELARKERARIDAALQTSSDKSTEAERLVLEQARERREQLEEREQKAPSVEEKITALEPAEHVASTESLSSPIPAAV